ncbi:MAG: DUF1311 domain-containing protein [Octadecabacter sp.]|nr:DUF1311 domain-containing protein [Octadecabacter sp.]
MIRLIGLAVLAPFAALAEPQPAVLALMPYMDITAACFDGAKDQPEATACIGQGSRVCMETETDGDTTTGMMFCAQAETESWDRLLNRDYTEMMDGMKAMDEDTAEHWPELANAADSLRAAQRAWILLRDADCTLEYAMWTSGSMRNIAGSRCRLQMTAERTIYLRSLGDYIR